MQRRDEEWYDHDLSRRDEEFTPYNKKRLASELRAKYHLLNKKWASAMRLMTQYNKHHDGW